MKRYCLSFQIIKLFAKTILREQIRMYNVACHGNADIRIMVMNMRSDSDHGEICDCGNCHVCSLSLSPYSGS